MRRESKSTTGSVVKDKRSQKWQFFWWADGNRRSKTLAWIIHEVSSQKRKDALKGMMNTGFADPAFPFGASIA